MTVLRNPTATARTPGLSGAMAVGLIAIVLVFAPTSAIAQERYQPGQMWRFKTEAAPTPARIVVGKVETLPEIGQVVHVSMIGIPLTTPQDGRVVYSDIWHLPFTAAAIVRSIAALEQSANVPPDFGAAYADWKRRYDTGEADVFDEPVGQVLRNVQRVLPDRAQQEIDKMDAATPDDAPDNP